MDVISPVLAKLINQSFEEGIFPSCLKTARVILIPIHKAGSKLKVNNYRPISTLQFLSKVIEKLIHARITNFFDRFNIFFKNQFGFLKKRSTNDAILEFTEFCYSAPEPSMKRNSQQLHYSTLTSKAFDTIDHNILVKKLECYGIRGKSNEWFCSYLANRKQYVEINDNKSITSTITCGVPQGSILGPLLFIIYVRRNLRICVICRWRSAICRSRSAICGSTHCATNLQIAQPSTICASIYRWRLLLIGSLKLTLN